MSNLDTYVLEYNQTVHKSRRGGKWVHLVLIGGYRPASVHPEQWKIVKIGSKAECMAALKALENDR